jgi:hypothetical protein
MWRRHDCPVAHRLMVYLIYNSYQGKNHMKDWEQRLKAMSIWLCCGEQVNTPMAKRWVSDYAILLYAERVLLYSGNPPPRSPLSALWPR